MLYIVLTLSLSFTLAPYANNNLTQKQQTMLSLHTNQTIIVTLYNIEHHIITTYYHIIYSNLHYYLCHKYLLQSLTKSQPLQYNLS